VSTSTILLRGGDLRKGKGAFWGKLASDEEKGSKKGIELFCLLRRRDQKNEMGLNTIKDQQVERKQNGASLGARDGVKRREEREKDRKGVLRNGKICLKKSDPG